MAEEATLSFKHPDGKLQTVQAHISHNDLILNKIFKVEGERTVVIDRNPKGGLGISVKGGAEHGIPVLISRVFMELTNDHTQTLQPGDAIIAVNGKRMDNLMHDEVVAELRNCGPCVQLTVRPFEEAHQVLQLAGSSKASEVIDGSDRLDADEDLSRIPLAFSRLEFYYPGTSRLMNNEMKIMTSSEKLAGFIKFSSRVELDTYANQLTTNIIKSNITTLKGCDIRNGTIHFAGWMEQLASSNTQQQQQQLSWVPCFIVISDELVYVCNKPPKQQNDLSTCKNVHQLHECLIRDHNLHNELFDHRTFCCSLQCDINTRYYLSFNTKDQLQSFTLKVRKLTTEAIFKFRKHSYDCKIEEEGGQLTLSVDAGFTMIRHQDKKMLWSFKFSQLAHSFDDGKNLIKLDFQQEDGKTIQKVFSCEQAYHLLYCIHSFLLAKLSIFGINNDEMTE